VNEHKTTTEEVVEMALLHAQDHFKRRLKKEDKNFLRRLIGASIEAATVFTTNEAVKPSDN